MYLIYFIIIPPTKYHAYIKSLMKRYRQYTELPYFHLLKKKRREAKINKRIILYIQKWHLEKIFIGLEKVCVLMRYNLQLYFILSYQQYFLGKYRHIFIQKIKTLLYLCTNKFVIYYDRFSFIKHILSIGT